MERDLTKFKKAYSDMVGTNLQAYNSDYWKNFRTPLRDYTEESINKIIDSGSLNEQQKLSENYFYKNGFYRKILIYYATLSKYLGILIPQLSYGKSFIDASIQKKYNKVLSYIDKINLPDFLENCALRAFIYGCYYGLIIKSDKTGFTAMDLPPEYCATNFKDYNGNDLIDFDLRYFYEILDEKKRESVLSIFPKEIRSAYRQWRKGKLSSSWISIPSNIGICFQMWDGRPSFLNIIPSTIDYEQSVDLEKERDLEEIRKIIVQHVPHLNDGTLLFEPEEAKVIHDGTVGMMKGNKNVSVLTSYGDVDAIVSKTSSDTVSNNLDKMMNNIYYEAGVSSMIFSPTNSQVVETSIKNDLAFISPLIHKFETFITSLINSIFQDKAISYKYSILPVTYYTDKEYIDNAFKLASSGYSLLLPFIAMGFSQKDLTDIKELENNYLDLTNILIPLQTSYTQSSDSQGGAPEKSLEEKSPKTLSNEEALTNEGE